jgi:hypothetical protein
MKSFLVRSGLYPSFARKVDTRGPFFSISMIKDIVVMNLNVRLIKMFKKWEVAA